MPLLTLLDAQLAHGDLPLLDRAAFSMESGERIGLIGRNGTGKSSLLSVIAGTGTLDDGELRKTDGLRVAELVRRPVFALLAIPLGYALGFIQFRPTSVTAADFALQLFGIYLTIAIPEELLFRGILQNLLVKSITRGPRGLYGLLIASVIFGAAHLHHSPAPNWRYAILATLAGVFYGNTFRTRSRVSAPALTHTLVDTVWHFWF